jgi:hypothetical protein
MGDGKGTVSACRSVAEWEAEELLLASSLPPASPLVVACWVLVTPMKSWLRYAVMEEQCERCFAV